jgi:hypothetical protein
MEYNPFIVGIFRKMKIRNMLVCMFAIVNFNSVNPRLLNAGLDFYLRTIGLAIVIIENDSPLSCH